MPAGSAWRERGPTMTRGLAPLRAAGGLQAHGGLTGPSHRRRGIVALAALLGGALAGGLLLAIPRSPGALDDVVLAGSRPPGCVNLVVADDFSGSMTSFTQQRAAAEQALVRWAAKNLQHDDRITLVAWAGTSTLVLPSTEVGALDPNRIAPVDLSGLGDGTMVQPMLDLVTSMPGTGCRIALMVISDSIIGDGTGDPDRLWHQLGAADVQSVSLLNPSGAVQSPEWQAMLPFTRVVAVDQSDPQDLSLALGGEVAAAIGQVLEVRG